MEVTETKAEGLFRSYQATAPAAEIAAKVDEKIEAVRGSAQLPGFRKGKVPASVLKQRFGKSMMGEAMQELVDETLRRHFEESGHKPAGQPDVQLTNEDFQEGDPLDLTFSYEMLPEIPEMSFGDIALERLVVSIAEEPVDKALQNLADNAKSFTDRDEGAAAEDGDQVVIDFLGKIDGEPFEGGAADDFPLTLGSGQFIPGFEPQLVGVKAGDERVVEVSFPEDYGAEALAGKAAAFDVTVKAVKAPSAAEIDDELAKKYGSEDLDGLKSQIRERLGEEYKGAARAVLKRGLLDALAARLSFDLPPSMVEGEAKQIAHQLWQDANPDAEERPEIEPGEKDVDLAKRRVGLGLLLADIGAKAKIEVSEAEMTNAMVAQARRYPGQEQAFLEFARQNAQLRQQISAPLFEDKVVDYILELATVTEKPVTEDELNEELQKLDDDEAATAQPES